MARKKVYSDPLDELLEKLNPKIITIFSGQKTQLKCKQDISLILEQNKLILYLKICIYHLLYFALMMPNFMVTGGMKVLIGYIYYSKKFIITKVILN